MHPSAPSPANFPAGQSGHGAVAPPYWENEPPAHSKHAPPPESNLPGPQRPHELAVGGAYEPTAQLVQELAPGPEYLLAAQLAHTPDEAAPVVAEASPALHRAQALELLDTWKEPAAHCVQLLAPAAEKEPAGQRSGQEVLSPGVEE